MACCGESLPGYNLATEKWICGDIGVMSLSQKSATVFPFPSVGSVDRMFEAAKKISSDFVKNLEPGSVLGVAQYKKVRYLLFMKEADKQQCSGEIQFLPYEPLN